MATNEPTPGNGKHDPESEIIDVEARVVEPAPKTLAERLDRIAGLLEAQTEATYAVGLQLAEWLPRITAILMLESKKAQNAAPDAGDAAKVLFASDEENIVEAFLAGIEEDGEDGDEDDE